MPRNALVADIASLRGRLFKDAFHRAPDRPGGRTLVMRAREQYLKAYAYARDPYPGINAASLAMLLGERDAALALAQEIRSDIARRLTPSPWELATDAEAQLLLGQLDAAALSYGAACTLAGDNAGKIATMRRQVRLLARAIPEARNLLPLLPAPDVVAFAGHMIDAPGRTTPRFPAALESAVRAAIDAELRELHQPVVFTSAACGADLIFIETALAHRAEVNVVLPFAREDFVRTSVAIGDDDWVQRFDKVLKRVARVIMATDENHLGDDILFEHAACLVEGLSQLRAMQLETVPSMLCVLDASSGTDIGGTRATYERWRKTVGPARVIDLAALRSRNEASVQGRSPHPEEQSVDEHVGKSADETRLPRSLKAMMFADFAGFSRVQDAFAPRFQDQFLRIAAAQIGESPVRPLDAKTWGDGLYVVFDSPQYAAEFALGFLGRAQDVDWTTTGLRSTIPVRIALHAGPVFRGFDPVMQREHFFGSSVTRAARIEPITQPGTVYASEAFAATLAAAGRKDFALEYIGRVALAKHYGESTIYRLDRE